MRLATNPVASESKDEPLYFSTVPSGPLLHPTAHTAPLAPMSLAQVLATGIHCPELALFELRRTICRFRATTQGLPLASTAMADPVCTGLVADQVPLLLRF